MNITVICKTCSKKYVVPASRIGQKGRCKRCGQIMVVAQPATEVILQLDDDEPGRVDAEIPSTTTRKPPRSAYVQVGREAKLICPCCCRANPYKSPGVVATCDRCKATFEAPPNTDVKTTSPEQLPAGRIKNGQVCCPRCSCGQGCLEVKLLTCRDCGLWFRRQNAVIPAFCESFGKPSPDRLGYVENGRWVMPCPGCLADLGGLPGDVVACELCGRRTQFPKPPRKGVEIAFRVAERIVKGVVVCVIVASIGWGLFKVLDAFGTSSVDSEVVRPKYWRNFDGTDSSPATEAAIKNQMIRQGVDPDEARVFTRELFRAQREWERTHGYTPK